MRYTSYTEIVRAGDVIEVNGSSINSPIIIKAIGNPKTLDAALNIKGGMVEWMELLGFVVRVKQEPKVMVPKSRKLHEFKFAEPFETQNN